MTAETRTSGGSSDSRGQPNSRLEDTADPTLPDPTAGLVEVNYTIFQPPTTRELVAIEEDPEPVEGDGTASPLRQYILIEEQADRLICSRYKDGAIFTPVGELPQVFITKPHEARRTVWEGKTIDGVTYTYPDPSNHSLRTATPEGENPVEQRYKNPYIPDFSLIYAADSIDGTEVGSTTLIEHNVDGRQWLSPSVASIIGIITGNLSTDPSGETYTWVEWTGDGQSFTQNEATDLTAKELNLSIWVNQGTVVVMIDVAGTWRFFFPIAAC